MQPRDFVRGEEEDIVDLLNTAFHGWPKYDLMGSAVDFWRWKYLDRSTTSGVSVIEDEEKLVSSHHTWRQEVWVKQRTYTFDEGMDYCVHPKYRGRGLSKIVSEQAREIARRDETHLCYFITENPIILKAQAKDSRVKPFPKKLVNLTKVKNISEQLRLMPVKNEWLVNIGYQLLSISNSILNMFKTKPFNRNVVVEEAKFFPESINGYWDQLKRHLDFSVVLNDVYLNWRYCDPRIGGYKIFLAKEDESIAGYVVIRINRVHKSYPVGYIVELSYPPGRTDIGYRLIERGLECVDDVNVINFLTVEGHPDIELLKYFGFLDSRIDMNMNYELYTEDDPLAELSFSPSKRIHLSWGDFDILPVKMPNK